MTATLLQCVRFGLVGLAATATHFAVGLVFIVGETDPLVANGIGFAAAFQISFLGHRRFTFPDSGASTVASLRRFSICAFGGFVLSELLLFALHAATSLNDSSTFAVALATVTGLTFLTQRFWVFRVNHSAPKNEAVMIARGTGSSPDNSRMAQPVPLYDAPSKP